MNVWLFKSDSDNYSFEHLQKDCETLWDGVRNFQARKYLMQVRTGDVVLFYESGRNPLAIWGICLVTQAGIPDPTQFDPQSPYFDPRSTPQRPRWITVRIRLILALRNPIIRSDLRVLAGWQDLSLWRQPRLSVMPVPELAWQSFMNKLGLKMNIWERLKIQEHWQWFPEG